jgi:hypothetical protein
VPTTYALDSDGHGTSIGTIIKGRHCGIASRASLVNVKTTDSGTLASGAIFQKSLLNVIRYVVTDHSVSGLKILNLSFSYRWPSLAVKCAMQWAYYAKVDLRW